MKLKWILVGLGGLIVIVIAAVAILLLTMNFDDLRPVIQAEAKKATGRDLTISGPIGLDISLNPAIDVEDVTFANAEWGSQPLMARVQRLELQVPLMPLLSGDIKIERLILVGPDILLETDAEGRGNWDFDAGEPAAAAESVETAEGQTVIPSIDHIEIRDGRLTFLDGASGASHRVNLSTLTASLADLAAPFALALEGDYNDTPFALDGQFGSLANLEQGPFPVDFTLEAGGAKIAAAGTVGMPLAGDDVDVKVSIEGDGVDKLAAIAGAEAPEIGAFSIAAKVLRNGDVVRLSALDATVADMHLTGDLAATLGGARMSIEGAVNADAIDLAALAPAGEDSAATAPSAGSELVFGPEPIPLDGLHAVDTNLDLAIGSLRLPSGMAMSNVKASVALADGRLRVEPLVAGLSGGSVTLSLDLDDSANAPRLRTKLAVRDVDLGRLLKDADVSEDVTGRLDADIELRGTGDSPRALASGLNGSIDVSGGEGTIDDRLVKIAAIGLEDVLDPLLGDDGGLQLECMAIHFDIENGLATSPAIVVDTSAFTLAGSGTVDLKAEKLDLIFDTESKQVGLASLAVPFRIGGTLAAPAAAPDPAGVAIGAARLAGTIFMPLPALAALVGRSQVSAAGENACVVAVEAAEQEAAEDADGGGLPSPASAIGGAAEGVGDTLQGVGEGISEGFKSLFGD